MGRHGPGILAALAIMIQGCSGSGESWALRCDFLPVETPSDQVEQCASREGSTGDPATAILLRPSIAKEKIPPGAVATVAVDGSLLFAIASGRTAPALPFDNGADYFAEGLARTARGGKVGFVDRSLEEVVAPAWDFAFPFELGLAIVCDGCSARAAGEHSEVVGGAWGYIDRTGAVVVPLVGKPNELPTREQVLAMDGRLHTLFQATHSYQEVFTTLKKAVAGQDGTEDGTEDGSDDGSDED